MLPVARIMSKRGDAGAGGPMKCGLEAGVNKEWQSCAGWFSRFRLSDWG